MKTETRGTAKIQDPTPLSVSDQRKTLIRKRNGDEFCRWEPLEASFRRQECRSKNSAREGTVSLDTHFWFEKMCFKAEKYSFTDQMPRQYTNLARSDPDHYSTRCRSNMAPGHPEVSSAVRHPN